MAEFVLKNKIFEFNNEIKHQIPGTVIGTKLAPIYAYTSMDERESKFIQTQEFQRLVSFKYIKDIFFVWAHDPGELVSFMAESSNYQPDKKLLMNQIKKISRYFI